MNKFEFLVKKEFNGYKLKDYLLKIGISKEIILKIKFNGLYVNQVKIQNINDFVKTNDKVTIYLTSDELNPFVKPIENKLEILYEDEYLVAVFKEKGMLTHCSRHNECISLDRLVYGHFKDRPFLFRAINRLDRDTSGIVLIAKDMLTSSFLGEQMKKGLIKKTYSAVVVGKPEEDWFIIEKSIKRKSLNEMKRVVSEDGKYAKSEVFFVKELESGLSLVDVLLHTGRTHQVRVHLASNGLPLYADALYGNKVDGKSYTLIAKSLEFTHPFTNKSIKIEVPKRFFKFIEKYS